MAYLRPEKTRRDDGQIEYPLTWITQDIVSHGLGLFTIDAGKLLGEFFDGPEDPNRILFAHAAAGSSRGKSISDPEDSPPSEEDDTCRPLMTRAEDWQSYVNDVGFDGVGNVAMDLHYHIDAGTQSSTAFLNNLRKAGWWWPPRRPNMSKEHEGGVNLQREVQTGKWLHITVKPAQKEVKTKKGTKLVDDWTKPPRDISIHCERWWLQPSSIAHLLDNIKERIE